MQQHLCAYFYGPSAPVGPREKVQERTCELHWGGARRRKITGHLEARLPAHPLNTGVGPPAGVPHLLWWGGPPFMTGWPPEGQACAWSDGADRALWRVAR
ncbi:hypothetical protein NDU88_002576 [Pleurodeles waltl]|uniref:Uncharacterized protein n=1 Tax=Pleurodeles waltl TaxID=8319 RepID=A0AAV7VZQ6_PLEWA|nr:hypothetical protein NDU88_002576 [Pleurodeles waltl]